MKYFLFLDESGDHGLAKFDPDFPVFLLCGVLVREDEYENIRQTINKLKHSLWGNKEVIFHSRDIRKCEKEFQKLFDLDIKKTFLRSTKQHRCYFQLQYHSICHTKRKICTKIR